MRGKFQDLTGQKFGRLTVIERAENAKGGKPQWLCHCDCGKKVVVRGDGLRSGETKSCGCWKKEKSTKHGLWQDKTYTVWLGIRQRCFNPNCDAFKNYGERGITMHEPWVDDPAAFIAYVSTLEHFGEEGYTLDRINNDGNYEPGNLRYATDIEQHRNQRTNVIVEYQGKQMCLTEAAEKSGINRGILYCRYQRGDRGDRLFRPVKK